MVGVAVGIVAAAALAFVGATIANADHVVEVPRVTGMTVAQARAALAEAAHVDPAEAPIVVGGRAYSESVAIGHVLAQTPRPATRVERTALDLVVRVSRGTAYAVVPDVEGALQRDAAAAFRRTGFAVSVRDEESWEVPEGHVISSDTAPGAEARRPGPDRARRLERPPESARSRRPGRHRGRCGCTARRQLRDGDRRGGLGHGAGRLGSAPVTGPGCPRGARLEGDTHRSRARRSG